MSTVSDRPATATVQAGGPEGGPGGRRARLAFPLLAAAALAAAAFVWFAMPHDREVKSLWILLVKLVPFVLAIEAAAALTLGLETRARLAKLAVPAVFLVYFCWFVPKIFFHADDGPTLYYHVLTLTPFLVVGLVLAYRLGGGGPGGARRLGYAMLLLTLSGLEDLAFLTVNAHIDPRWTPIPETWDWASHMTVFLGHPASRLEAYAFIAVHVVLAGLVLFLPGRAVSALARRGRRRPG